MHCAETGFLLLDSERPELSLIYLKQNTAPPCGSSMPFPLGPMDGGAAAACVLSWIRSRLR